MVRRRGTFGWIMEKTIETCTISDCLFVSIDFVAGRFIDVDGYTHT